MEKKSAKITQKLYLSIVTTILLGILFVPPLEGLPLLPLILFLHCLLFAISIIAFGRPWVRYLLQKLQPVYSRNAIAITRLFPTLATTFVLSCLGNALLAQSISGTIFYDGDRDGSQSPSEVGFPGIVVRAYNPAGAMVSSAISQDIAPVGQFTITGLSAGVSYRLEYELPLGISAVSSITGMGTTVQFFTAGATNANLGLYVPSQAIASDNPRVLAGCGLDASNSGMTTSVPSWLYNSRYAYSGPSSSDPHESDLTAGQVGIPMGFAADGTTMLVYMSTIASDFSASFPNAPDGIGAIYVADYTGMNFQSYKLLVDVVADLGINVSNQNQITVGKPNQFGEYGLGGIDLSADRTKLYTINMGNGKIIQIDISGVNYASLPATKPNTALELTIPSAVLSCSNGNFRPTALKQYAGLIYVAGVCDATNGNSADLKGLIVSYNPASGNWAQVFSTSLDFVVGSTASGNTGITKPQAAWNVFPPMPGEDLIQPYISAFDFDESGSLVIGFSDRQNVLADWVYVNTGGANAGYLLRTWKKADGSFELENNGVSGPYTTSADLRNGGSIPGETSNKVGLAYGPGGQFFYEQGLSFQFGHHDNLFSSGLVIIPGKNEILAGYTDPLDYSTIGARYLNTKNGRTDYGIHLAPGKRNLITGVNRIAPAAAMEIGNRVWLDTDADGVQDADESGIANVAIELYADFNNDGNPDGAALATTMTASDGTWYFNADNVPDGDPSVAGSQLSVQPGKTYLIRLGATDWTGGVGVAELVGLFLTSSNVGGAGQPDVRDNDATIPGSNIPTISHTTTSVAGQNDHTLDMGFRMVNCPTGNCGTTTVVKNN